MGRRTWICFLCGAVSVLFSCSAPEPESEANLPGQGDDAGKTVIYRDTWGVPHIYAPTVEAALYAQGWAQAEDRPEQLLVNLLIANGEYASIAGEAALQSDIRSHMWDHYGVSKAGFDSLKPELQSHLRAFADGMNAFYDAHPDDRPAWWGERRIDPYMIVAFGRLFLFNWSIDEAYGDLRRSGIEPGYERDQRGSNQFAVAPGRSAEGAAILAIDPHLSWTGPSRFWEFRVHTPEWSGSGVTLPGSPYIGLGHTEHLAWAMTTGGPDTADIYELEMESPTSNRYRWDGGWRELTSRTVEIAVRDEAAPRQVEIWSSHHGPIIARHGSKAYAARMAYADVVNGTEAWYELNFADDYQGAVRAMATLAVFPQNVMVADTSGNIYYQRTGRVGKRPRIEGVDWSTVVDGSTSATEWQGWHAAEDHLQVLNPEQGWMQNCNIPPDAMMPSSPFVSGEHPDYLFSSRDYGAERSGWTNQRGARAVELLSADDSVTAEEALAYITDLHPYGTERWIELLRHADDKLGKGVGVGGLYPHAVAEVLEWDQRVASDSSAALKYDYWRQQLREDLGADAYRDLESRVDDWYAVIDGELDPVAVEDAELEPIGRAFAKAMDRLKADHGSIDAVYGDHYRVGRGDQSWPVGGGNSSAGTTTLRAMSYTDERDDHTRWGRGGQTSTQIVVMTEPPQSWIYIPLGESDREESPHYDDQAEKLFSERKLKPSWWRPEELVGNVEERVVLEVSPSR